MLSIGKLVAGQEGYYEKQVAQGHDDYYSGRGESAGEWSGEGAEALGLQGTVDGEQFSALVAGRDPESGAALRETNGRHKIGAFDLTFSAPKSVSVLYAIADPETSEAIREIHDEAVTEGMRYLESEALRVRRGKGGRERIGAEGFVSARYRHRMSRAEDPQLHTHVVTANLARGTDGRWSALDAYRIYQHAKAGGSVYQAQLRAAFRERFAWARWGEVTNGVAELEGVSEDARRHFSQRSAAIEEWIDEHGSSAAGRRRENAVKATREAKSHGIDTTSWREAIRSRAAEHGLGRDELTALTAQIAPAQRAVDAEELGAELAGPRGLTETRNSFAERDAVVALATAHRDGLAAAETRELAKGFVKRVGVPTLDGGDDPHYTTEDLLRCERAIVEGARRRREAADSPAVGEEILGPAIAAGRVALNADQRAAVEEIATSAGGVETIEALAGTGKTTVAGALRSVYESAGIRVLGTAPTARAARELASVAEIADARTMARLRLDLEADGGFGTAPTVLVIDEAGMASTREAAAIMAHAERAGVKVVAIGDSGQLASVAAGGWLGSLSRRHGSKLLTEVMRQRDPREAALLSRIHDGAPAPYVRLKAERGELCVFESRAEAESAIAARWWQRQSEPPYGQAIMVSRDNEARERLNARARERLLEAGRLGESIEHGGREFSVGDRVIARHNDRRADLDNGMRATVRAIDRKTGALVVETDASGVRELPASYAAEHLDHAYALTGHGSQGATVESVGAIGLPSDFSKNWGYTALSRARGETRIYLVDEASRQAERRAEIAPEEDRSLRDDPVVRMERALRIRDDEDLALDALEPPAVPGDLAREQGAEPQEAAAIRLDSPAPGLPADVEPLRRELLELEAKLASFPAREERELGKARTERVRSQKEARTARARLDDLERRGEIREAAIERQRAEQAERNAAAAAKREAKLAPRVPSRKQWEAEMAPQRERYGKLKAEFDARRNAYVSAAIASPGRHLTEALGAPPSDARGRRTWSEAAQTVERYRFEQGVAAPTALGERPTGAPAERAWREAAEKLQRAQRLLGRTPARDLGRSL